MDEKVLKWVTRLIGLLTVGMCILLVQFPRLNRFVAAEKAKRAAAAEEKAEREAAEEALMTAKIEAMMERAAMAETESESESASEELERITGMIHNAGDEAEDGLRIELPPGVGKKDVKVKNRYIYRNIRISFSGDIPDYFASYHVTGTSSGVTDMTYYTHKGTCTLELQTDEVYETETEIADGVLNLRLVRPQDKYDKIVVLDAGHGGVKSGAEREGIMEKDINLAIVKAFQKLFDQQKDSKIGVFYTRLEDEDISLEQRVGLANALKADLFLSMHCNSTASSTAAAVLNGTQVLYDEADRSEHSSKQLAEICLREMCSELSSKDMGLLRGDEIYIIRNSKAPVALIETGFMTYHTELEKLNSGDYQKKAAQGIYNSIKRAFEKGY